MAIPTDQQAHRDAFGRAYTVWLKRNSFSQQTSHDWAAAASSEGPWNSQTSLLCRGRLDGKPQFFVALGRFNAAIATADLPPSLNRRARDLIKDAQPFLTADGNVATASDFFSMFIGEQPLREEYTAAPAYSDDDAAAISQMCRDAFRKNALDQMLAPPDAWQALKEHCHDAGMTASEITRMHEVLSGWGDWSGDEVNALSIPGELGKPAKALEAWCGAGLTLRLPGSV